MNWKRDWKKITVVIAIVLAILIAVLAIVLTSGKDPVPVDAVTPDPPSSLTRDDTLTN